MLRATRRLSSYRHGPAILALAESFLPYFPELRGTVVELDLLPSSSWLLGLADGMRPIPRIRLRPARPTNPTLTYTIPHELTHLLQRPLGLLPQGERSCDLFAMARAGERFRVAPGYVRVPRSARLAWPSWAWEAADLAREAVRRRSRGERTYIAWWEATFRARATHRVPTADRWGGLISAAARPGETPAGTEM